MAALDADVWNDRGVWTDFVQGLLDLPLRDYPQCMRLCCPPISGATLMWCLIHGETRQALDDVHRCGSG